MQVKVASFVGKIFVVQCSTTTNILPHEKITRYTVIELFAHAQRYCRG